MSRLPKQLSTKTGEAHLDRGRQEGREEGEAKVTLCQFNRRCGPLSEATTARLQALPLDQLEALAEALLDFNGPADLAVWLAERQELLGLQAVKALTANVVFGIRGRGHLVRRHSHLQEQVLEVVVVPPPGG